VSMPVGGDDERAREKSPGEMSNAVVGRTSLDWDDPVQDIRKRRPTMQRLDYRYYYHVVVAEEQIRSLRRERRWQAQLRRDGRLSEPRPERRRRWSLADLVCLHLPSRQHVPQEVQGR
jgi:hypothetical protein